MALSEALERNPNLARWACHIRQRLVERRLSLLTGAGISIECGAPSWSDLVASLAKKVPGFDDTFAKHKTGKIQDTMLTQFIHSRYIDEYLKNRTDIPDDHINIRARIEWFSEIRNVIYEKIPSDIAEIEKNHPYLSTLSTLCTKCHSTITFNFDDILDQIATKNTPEFVLPPKTTWQLPEMDSQNVSYIYHINGLLPQNPRKKASEKLIFTEDSFLQVLYGAAGSNNHILHSFTNSTYLLVGLSLDDHSLKSILSTNAMRSPGSIHYIIHWLRDSDALSSEQRNDISRANFEMFSLVTIFLTSEEIGEFIDLIQTGVESKPSKPDDTMDEAFIASIRNVSELATVRYRYYIAGPVGSGKSTLLESLRSFRTLEEWPEKTPPELYQDHKLLSEDQRLDVNAWIYRQLKIKNRLFDHCIPGIHIMDRAPLDLFAFSVDEKENASKAAELESKVEADGPLVSGEILLVVANKETLLERQLRRGRIPTTVKGGMSYDGESLQKQREELEETYPGARVYSSDECDVLVLAKRVVADVIFSDYNPLNMSGLNQSRKAAIPD